MSLNGSGRLFVDHSRFFLLPDAEQWWDADGFDSGQLIAVADNGRSMMVRTGIRTGSVNIEMRAGAPSDAGEWEGVEEVSVLLQDRLSAVPLCEVRLDDSWYEPVLEVPAPGMYRVRVSCRARKDDFLETAVPEDHWPTEWFLVEVWPAPASPKAVVRHDGLEEWT